MSFIWNLIIFIYILTYCGEGSSHFLCRKRYPPPQAAVHSDQSPHGPQDPSICTFTVGEGQGGRLLQ